MVARDREKGTMGIKTYGMFQDDEKVLKLERDGGNSMF